MCNRRLQGAEHLITTVIDDYGRKNYLQAAGHLAQVKKLYQKQGREPEWQEKQSNLNRRKR